MQSRGQKVAIRYRMPSPVDECSGDPRPAKKVKKVYTWTCQYCMMEFQTEVYSQRYCSKTHKKYAQKDRKREREQQAENVG
jgi:hypothetical protein